MKTFVSRINNNLHIWFNLDIELWIEVMSVDRRVVDYAEHKQHHQQQNLKSKDEVHKA